MFVDGRQIARHRGWRNSVTRSRILAKITPKRQIQNLDFTFKFLYGNRIRTKILYAVEKRPSYVIISA